MDLCTSDIEALSAQKKCDSCIQANKKPVSLVLHATPGTAGITLQKSDDIKSFSSESEFNLAAGIGVEVGLVRQGRGLLSAGLSLDYASYNSNLGVDLYHDTVYNRVDYDGDPYSIISEMKNLKETDHLSYLQVPLYVRYDYSFSRIIALYLKVGAKAGFTISNKYTTTGSCNYKGKYSEDYGGVILYGNDLPEGYNFGLYDVSIDATNKQVGSFDLSVFGGLGLNFAVTSKLDIFLGAEYTQGVSNISNNSGEFDLTTKKTDVSSFIGYSKATTHAFGVDIGLRFKLMKY